MAIGIGIREAEEDEGGEQGKETEHTAQWEHDVCHDEAVYISSLSPPSSPLTFPAQATMSEGMRRGRRTNEDDERLLSQWQTGVLALRVNSLTHSTVAIQWKKSGRKERPSFLPTLCPPPHPHPHAHMPTHPFPHLKVLSSPGPRDLELT